MICAGVDVTVPAHTIGIRRRSKLSSVGSPQQPQIIRGLAPCCTAIQERPPRSPRFASGGCWASSLHLSLSRNLKPLFGFSSNHPVDDTVWARRGVIPFLGMRRVVLFTRKVASRWLKSAMQSATETCASPPAICMWPSTATRLAGCSASDSSRLADSCESDPEAGTGKVRKF
jgi:hypothetical protein